MGLWEKTANQDVSFPMRRYKDTYRIDSTRLPGHDYASAGWYHVVICTQDRACVLGRVRGGIMGLSRAGCVVAQEWQKTPRIRPYVRLDAWMVMPNHMHGIIGITTEAPARPSVETARRAVSTPEDAAHSARLQAHSLGAIIGQFKSVCTKRIRRTGLLPDFAWQPRFYDRVIRNERERWATRRYVLNNPLTWRRDPYFSG